MNKNKYSLEFDMKGVPPMLLWNQVATPPGLAQWFADDVKQEGKELIFSWKKGGESRANIIAVRSGNYVRYRWEDDEENEKVYFEFKIVISELTSNTTLIITDFAEDEADLENAKDLWNYQIDILRRKLGCM